MSNDLNDLQRRVAELERKEAIRSHKETGERARFNKFIDRTRQAVIIFLAAVEDWGNLNRTIPPRKK